VIEKDQSNRNRSHQKGNEHVHRVHPLGLELFRVPQQLRYGNVQKGAPPHGQQASHGHLSKVDHEDQQGPDQDGQAKDEIDQECHERVHAALVDHDQVSGQLVGELVENRGKNDRDLDVAPAPQKGDPHENAVRKVVEDFTEVVRDKQGHVFEADHAAECHKVVGVNIGIGVGCGSCVGLGVCLGVVLRGVAFAVVCIGTVGFVAVASTVAVAVAVAVASTGVVTDAFAVAPVVVVVVVRKTSVQK